MTSSKSPTPQSANDLETAEDRSFREMIEAAIADLFRAPPSPSEEVASRAIEPDEDVPFRHRYPQRPPLVRACETCGDLRFYPS